MKSGDLRAIGRTAMWSLLLAALLVAASACSAPSGSGTSGGGGPSPVAGAFPPPVSSPAPGVSATPANGPGRFVEVQGAEHVEKGAPHAEYTTKPPTSGPHWSILGEAPVPWGIYSEPVPEEAQVHNLEHGGIMIQYNCRDCPDLVRQLEAFFSQYTAAKPLPRYPQSAKLVIAPYYDMPTRLALTAWGRIDTLDSYDEARVTRFVDAYRDNGPEAVP